MIVHLDKEQTKEARRNLLNDTVYVIFHDVLKGWQKDGVTEFSPVELFLAARSFAITVLALPDVMEGLEDEMKDLEDEVECENDAMIVMMLASGIFQAIGTHRIGFDSKLIIMKIFERWSDHPLFFTFLDEGCKKEQARWIADKKTNLLKYELEQIEADGEGEDVARGVLMDFVQILGKMDADSIKALLLVLNKYNIEHGNKYNDVMNALYDKLGIKSTTLLSAEEVVLHKSVDRQAVVYKGGVGFQNLNK